MIFKTARLAFFTLLLSFSTQLPAQSADYVKGQLYLKVKNDAGIILPEIRQEKDVILLEKLGFSALFALCEDYEVFHLERAFRGLGNENLEHTYLLKFRQTGFELELADKAMRLNFIEYAVTEPIYYTTLTPNDYTGSTQWYLDRIKALDAWDISTGSPNIKLGIVDAGFLTSHPDLAGNMWINPGEIPGNGIDDDANGYIDDVTGWDAGNNDPNPNPPAAFASYFSHGTSVAGSASPVTNNAVGIAGIGFSCSIVPIKGKTDGSAANTGGTQQERESLDATTAGITYAIRAGVDVINMSFGGPTSNSVVENLMIAAHDAGIVLVAAAGNDGTTNNHFPSNYPHVINVGATNSNDRKSGFSNYGSTIDVMAPGSGIRTTIHTGALNPTYFNTSGTSTASPIVAGLVGLMVSTNPCLSPFEIEQYLKATADDIDNLNTAYRGLLGAGRINADAALKAIAPAFAPLASFHYDTTSSCDGTIEFFYDGANSGCPDEIRWSFNGQTSSEQNPVFGITDTGSYQVTLFAQNKLGSNRDSMMIRINHVLLADAGGNQAGVLTACVGEAIQLNASTNYSGSTFSWSPAIGITSTAVLNPTVGALTNRVYSLTVTDSTGCQTTDEVELVVVNSVDAGADQTINLGDTAQLDVAVVASGYTYAWTPATDLNNPLIKNPKASPTMNTTYQVTATTFSGCDLTDQVTVNVNGGLGLFDNFAAIGRVYPAYPNPASAEIFLSATLDHATSLSVKAYDLTGREIATLHDGKVPSGEIKLTWQQDAALSPGIYMLVWLTPEARFVQKVEWR